MKMDILYCQFCGAKLVNDYDNISKKVSEYLWTCPKGCMKKAGIGLSVG